jgi:hypothetical protein
MPLTLNQFDSGVTTAIVERLRAYLAALGEEYSAKVVEQTSEEVQERRMVQVSATELEESVYQSGHYRAGIEVTVKVDAKEENAGGPAQFKALSAAVLDALQQTDLETQLNAVTDETGRALCVVQGITLEQSRIEDVGDWMLRRTYTLNVYGFNPSNS